MTSRSVVTPVVVALLAGGLAGCFRQIPPPDIHQNPQPREHYRITMRIGDDAPGPFDGVSASAGYQVTNERCVPMTPISGATLAPREYVDLPVTQIDRRTYVAEFYRDRLLDQDYYGQGVCQWEFVSVHFGPSFQRTSFAPDLMGSDLAAGHFDLTHYFSTYWYFNPSPTPYVPSSSADRSTYRDPAKTFTVSLHVERLP